MILQLFETNQRSGRDCINYLLGADFKRKEASVVTGSPILTCNIIDSLKFKKRYVSGCLAFTEKELDHNLQLKIINLFMDVVRGNLLPHQINFLWVKHKDKRNLELNFVIPCVDLVTLRSIDLFLPDLDRDFCHKFCDYVNAKYNLDSPKDPINNGVIYFGRYDSDRDIEVKKYLHIEVGKNIVNGRIASREELIKFLESYQLTFEKAYKKSLVFRNHDDNKILFLRGAIYSENFIFSNESLLNIEKRSLRFKSENTNNVYEYFQELMRLVNFRKKRYQRFELSINYRYQIIEDAKSCFDDTFSDDDFDFLDDLFIKPEPEAICDLNNDTDYADEITRDSIDTMPDDTNDFAI
ncbi:MAG: relaxase/mobilization nuclease domain-containing protein [Moraxellaceae bacterium]|nr:relaxase/mobilization nuclease domain-containing protein [Moraxellaceae bacterium]MDZ4387825.1 relaxase/mobilization nuclease domain-containing protein [Moraxellaceae bacterium]